MDEGWGLFFGIVGFCFLIAILCIVYPDDVKMAVKRMEERYNKTTTKEEIEDAGYSIESNGDEVQLVNDKTGEIIKNDGITINNNGTLNITINIDNIENIENLTIEEILKQLTTQKAETE